mgnify:CR=1 FL=1
MELLPGALAWGTLILLTLFSWKRPGLVAIFIVFYDLYWFLRILYLFLHLQHSFRELRRNLKMDWMGRMKKERLAWERVRHLVILPMYLEPYEMIRESLKSLVATAYPKENIFVVLGVEARGGAQDAEVAQRIKEEFKKTFGALLVTVHPEHISGELPGKGSNETWAAKEAVKNIVDAARIPYEDVMVSVFDGDTRVAHDYFGILTYKFLTAEYPLRSSYQPIPLFINNLEEVPAFARMVGVSSTFWQLMQQSRREQLATFSSHAMPLAPLVELGYWHTHVVSEDSRIFFQAFLHFNGDWRTVPLHYPIYMDAVVGKTFWDALKNLYRQQRRWAWGSENIPYVIQNFIGNKKISFRKKWLWSYVLLESFHAWATSSFIIFLFGWLPNALGGFAFKESILSYNMTEITGTLINASTIGIISSAFFNLFLIPRVSRGTAWLYYTLAVAQWILMPLTVIFFGSIPALEAQTRLMFGGKWRLGFWKTPKDRRTT